MTTRAEVATEARTWLGTPYHRQGYSRAGCDCFGLIAGVALALQLPDWEAWKHVPEYHNYALKPDARVIVECCSRFMTRIPEVNATTADVLLLQHNNDPIYFALITNDDPISIIHAISIVGKVVEHRLDEKWRSHIVRAYALPGVS